MPYNKIINTLLIGGYPPPYGGISVHIERLHWFINKRGDKCQILHTRFSKSQLIKNNDIVWIYNIVKLFKIRKTNPIVHIHVSALRNLVKIYLLIRFFKNQRKLITIHSGTFIIKLKKQSIFGIYLLKNILDKFNYVITVNFEQKQLLSNNLKIDKDKIVVIPAFIHPSSSRKGFNNKDISLIKQSNRIKLVTSGYLQDYYGYDLILDYLENHQNFYGFFVFYGTHDEKYKNRILNRIKVLDNTHFFTALSPKKFNWLLKNADVYIRNTDRDGDCVAIREAAYWGKKICASSVVTRPDGTELFSFNDKIEFKIAIQKVINKPNSGKIEPGINYANNVYKLYKSLIQQM